MACPASRTFNVSTANVKPIPKAGFLNDGGKPGKKFGLNLGVLYHIFCFG